MPRYNEVSAGVGHRTSHKTFSITGYTGQKANGANDGQKFEVLQRINKVRALITA